MPIQASAPLVLARAHGERLPWRAAAFAPPCSSAAEHNHQPLEDPRVRLQLNDARNHLLLTEDGTYDMVSSEPSNPWLSGVSNLFRLEFFQLGKRKMRPGGVWAQWIQTYGMKPEDLRSLLGTMGAVFRHLRLFRVDVGDLIVIASDEPLPLDASTMRRNYGSNLAVLEDLERIGFVEPERILGLYMLGTERIRVLVGNEGLNTDDNMRIEYAAPLALHVDTGSPNTQMIFGSAETPLASVGGLPGLVALAKSYKARDPGTRRARAALSGATPLQPASRSRSETPSGPPQPGPSRPRTRRARSSS